MMISGMIHDEIDCKLLILYIVRRLPVPIDKESLFEICICDNGVEYFDFSQYLDELVETENIAVNEEDDYFITEKGARNGEAVETSLPKSVRVAADKALAPVVLELKRRELVKTSVTTDENGATVHLSLSDGEILLLNLDIFCGDETSARQIRRDFRKNAESRYGKILDMLTENKRKIK